MSRDSSGTYTAPSNSVNPAVEGTAIDETDFNALVDDVESALTDSLDRTGKGKITAHIDFDETTVSSPAANVGRLYGKDVGGVTSLFFKDSAGTDTNLLLASSGLAYTFSTTTTMADPGSGYIRFNNATLASVTAIAIDDNDANAADLSAFVLTWDDVGTSNRGTLIIQNRTSPGSIAIFTISGASTDNSGWTELAVTYVTHAGSFGANAPLAVTYSRPGATGATGSSAAVGFSVHKNGTSQTGLADASFTQITWGTEVYDVGGYFASNQWVPPAGKISISAALLVGGTMSASSQLAIAIRKNGGGFKQASWPSFTNFGGVFISCEDEANGADAYSVWLYPDISSGTADVDGSSSNSYFCGHWIGT